ncbi:MAG: pyruvate kinase [bacterium]
MINLEKKTKIVCTIGPVTSSVEKLSALLQSGMNVMRLNFSHGDFAEHQVKVDNLKVAVAKTGIPCAVLQDLGGPKIRIGMFKTESVTLKEGAFFTLTTDKIEGDETRVSVNYAPLPKEVKVGGYIMLHDGKKKLQIVEIKGSNVKCKIIVGGDIKGKRGVNLPGAYLSIASLTDKDKSDIAFGLKNKVDFFAFSFVRRPSDVEELRGILNKAKSDAKIIAKIEDQEAIENIDKLVALVDGVMIGRGDLAIEIGAENMPITQKMIIDKCNAAGKPVITATQMFESMIKNATPTRAEVSDVANAIFEGTDAVMLSEETTLGDYPVQAVSMMALVSKTTEAGIAKEHEAMWEVSGVVESVGAAAVQIAHDIRAKAIFVLTNSGQSVFMVSKNKPNLPIIGMTHNVRTANQLLLSYGCKPVLVPKMLTLAEVSKQVRDIAKQYKIGVKGDKVVVVAGMPLGKTAETSAVMVEVI